MNKQSFEVWMAEVDALIAEELGGLTSEDLPDAEYYDYYEADCTPLEVAAEVLGFED